MANAYQAADRPPFFLIRRKPNTVLLGRLRDWDDFFTDQKDEVSNLKKYLLLLRLIITGKNMPERQWNWDKEEGTKKKRVEEKTKGKRESVVFFY